VPHNAFRVRVRDESVDNEFPVHTTHRTHTPRVICDG
jgi:hypothetical protein